MSHVIGRVGGLNAGCRGEKRPFRVAQTGPSSGCRQRSPGKRLKPRPVVINSAPTSIARAAWNASATRLPLAPAAMHNRRKVG